jgi:hypothetical protein
MKTYRFLILSAALILGAVILSSNAEGQTPTWSHKAYFTFTRPVEIPGRILPPGTYLLKLIAPEMHAGQILSADETEAFGTFFTMTIDRKPIRPLLHDVLLEPRQKGDVKWDRLKGWFSNGETIGDEISYDRFKPVEP